MNKLLLTFICILGILPFVSVTVKADEFITKGNDTYYEYDDGTYAKGLVKIDGKSYYFSKDGKLVKNSTVKVNDNIYYFGKNGTLTKKVDGFVKLGGKEYYCIKGKIQKNILLTISEEDDQYAYFNTNGVRSRSENRILVDINGAKLLISTDNNGYLSEAFVVLDVITNKKYHDFVKIDKLVLYTDGRKVYAEGNYTVYDNGVQVYPLSGTKTVYTSLTFYAKIYDKDGYVIRDKWQIQYDNNFKKGDKIKINNYTYLDGAAKAEVTVEPYGRTTRF